MTVRRPRDGHRATLLGVFSAEVERVKDGHQDVLVRFLSSGGTMLELVFRCRSCGAECHQSSKCEACNKQTVGIWAEDLGRFFKFFGIHAEDGEPASLVVTVNFSLRYSGLLLQGAAIAMGHGQNLLSHAAHLAIRVPFLRSQVTEVYRAAEDLHHRARREF